MSKTLKIMVLVSRGIIKLSQEVSATLLHSLHEQFHSRLAMDNPRDLHTAPVTQSSLYLLRHLSASAK